MVQNGSSEPPAPGSFGGCGPKFPGKSGAFLYTAALLTLLMKATCMLIAWLRQYMELVGNLINNKGGREKEQGGVW